MYGAVQGVPCHLQPGPTGGWYVRACLVCACSLLASVCATAYVWDLQRGRCRGRAVVGECVNVYGGANLTVINYGVCRVQLIQ